MELAPRSDYVFATRAYFRISATSDINGATADAERAISLGPAFAYSHEVMGLSHMTVGNFEKASHSLQKAVALSENSTFLSSRLFWLSISQYFMGEPREAIRTIDRAIQLAPRQRGFHLLQTICCRLIGDEITATNSEEKVNELPKEPSVLVLRPPLPENYRDFANQIAPT